MKATVAIKLVLLTLGATAFYTYVGQLVPQKEVYPPEVLELPSDLSQEEMVRTGEEIFNGKGLCSTCHTIGQTGALRFPDLAGIGSRAANRIEGMSGLEYLYHSLTEPDEYVVEGFNPGMPRINRPPVDLTDDEIKTVLAYLQSLGGTVTVSMDTNLAAPGEELVPAEEDVVAGETGGQDLFDRFECRSCHYVDQPGRLNAPSLYDVGSRKNFNEILTAILSVEGGHSPSAFYRTATLADAREMANQLAQKKGGAD